MDKNYEISKFIPFRPHCPISKTKTFSLQARTHKHKIALTKHRVTNSLQPHESEKQWLEWFALRLANRIGDFSTLRSCILQIKIYKSPNANTTKTIYQIIRFLSSFCITYWLIIMNKAFTSEWKKKPTLIIKVNNK